MDYATSIKEMTKLSRRLSGSIHSLDDSPLRDHLEEELEHLPLSEPEKNFNLSQFERYEQLYNEKPIQNQMSGKMPVEDYFIKNYSDRFLESVVMIHTYNDAIILAKLLLERSEHEKGDYEAYMKSGREERVEEQIERIRHSFAADPEKEKLFGALMEASPDQLRNIIGDERKIQYFNDSTYEALATAIYIESNTLAEKDPTRLLFSKNKDTAVEDMLEHTTTFIMFASDVANAKYDDNRDDISKERDLMNCGNLVNELVRAYEAMLQNGDENAPHNETKTKKVIKHFFEKAHNIASEINQSLEEDLELKDKVGNDIEQYNIKKTLQRTQEIVDKFHNDRERGFTEFKF